MTVSTGVIISILIAISIILGLVCSFLYLRVEKMQQVLDDLEQRICRNGLLINHVQAQTEREFRSLTYSVERRSEDLHHLGQALAHHMSKSGHNR